MGTNIYLNQWRFVQSRVQPHELGSALGSVDLLMAERRENRHYLEVCDSRPLIWTTTERMLDCRKSCDYI
jgi:hypothetical protein